MVLLQMESVKNQMDTWKSVGGWVDGWTDGWMNRQRTRQRVSQSHNWQHMMTENKNQKHPAPVSANIEGVDAQQPSRYAKQINIFIFILRKYIVAHLTLPMRHLYCPGAVKRVGVEVWKARRQNCPCFAIDIASTKGYRSRERDRHRC